MAKDKNQAVADQAVADQAVADQAAADQAAADQAAADQAAADQAAAEEIEVALLRDSALGLCGEVVYILASDIEAYKQHGMIDDHPDAVNYAKSQLVKN